MTAVNNGTRAPLISSEAFAVTIVAKLVSSSSDSVSVSPHTRTSDNAFVVVIVAKLAAAVVIAAYELQ